jgi:myo-inositol-1(or 4)-monophosphatase
VTFAQGRNGSGAEQGAGDARPDELRALSRCMHDAATQAAAFIREHAARLGELTWDTKSPADFVTDVDRGAERIVRDVLLAAYPDAVFVGEETFDASLALGAGLAFVVDPLDGTTNFLHGFPWYAVSIGATRNGALVAGVVLNAATGERFSATLGGGAWRTASGDERGRDERIAVSTITEPERALVGTGFPFKHLVHLDAYQRQFAAVTSATAGIRRAGAAALDLCDVACGRFDGFWELTLAPWDIAAGILIVQEAGGVITDLAGAPAPIAFTPIIAGNPAMHAWLRTVVDAV